MHDGLKRNQTELNFTFLISINSVFKQSSLVFFIVLMVSIYCNLGDKWLLVAAVLS